MVRSLFLTQQNTILSLLDSGHSGEAIAKRTCVSLSAISKLCSHQCSLLPKAVGGHPSKLSPINIQHAQHLITSGKAENAVQVTKAHQHYQPAPLCQYGLPPLEESWYEGCGQVKIPPSFCQALQSSLRLYLCSQGLDYRGLEEGHMV